MPKKKAELEKQKKNEQMKNYWITLVILLVVFTAGFFKQGLLGKFVNGMEKWLLGDGGTVVILVAAGWASLNAWHIHKDEPKESIWPPVLAILAFLLFMTYIDTDLGGFYFFDRVFTSFLAYFSEEVPVNNGGGLVGGLAFGIFSVALGKPIVILVIVILSVASAVLLIRSDTFNPGFKSASEKVTSFLKVPEPDAEEELELYDEPELDEEPKPVVNLWKMIDEHKEKRRESNIGKISVTQPPADEPEVQLMNEERFGEREQTGMPKYSRMLNITADGPTEEILLVSIPGKTVSSKKSVFINVDDLEEEPETITLMREEVSRKEKKTMQWLSADEGVNEKTEEAAVETEPVVETTEEFSPLPPVQQKLPLEETAPSVPADTTEKITKRRTARTRKTDNEKPYVLPSPNLLDPVPPKNRNSANEIDAREKGELLIQILRNFEVESKLIDTHIGPSVTQFEIRPDPNVKISKISSLTDNIKMQLAAKDIRIEAPIPGRNAIGVEIPNAQTTPVKMKEMISDITEKDKKSPLLFFLGKDLLGRTVTCRLDKMPHLLIAGATGSGKSVCMNAIITSLLLRTDPDKVKMLLVDPKKVEFTPYRNIPHLIGPVINDSNQANNALKVIVQKMDERYNMFAAAGVRNIEGYNAKVIAQDGKPNEDGSPAPKYMPYIVVIIDELADLMIVAGKEVENSIQRITQLARAAGIHLIVATQRPSVNVITGVIKANIPSRIAFSVSSAIDSRTILDSHGAERLLGNGDMLYLPMGTNSPTRVQGVYVTDEEVMRITEAVSQQKKPHYDDAFILLEGVEGSEGTAIATVTDDPMFEEVKEYVIQAQKASTSLLQRRFGIGYNRAARMIDALEENGIIGPAQGSKPRDVYIKPETASHTTETGGTYE